MVDVPKARVAGDYLSRYRRLLIDTHIPDWDERFLEHFDPQETVRQAAAAGATALMVYFQSHTGLCHWATASGRQHRALVGRDVLAEMLAAAGRAGLPVCAYYSVNFNNWAHQTHPDWRMRPAAGDVIIGGGLLPGERYGICCYNNRDYAAFVATQAREILGRYRVDAFFFDMVFWMTVCLCDACRSRYRAEAGREFPTTVDWLDPAWCDFQDARERWLTAQARELGEVVRSVDASISVYHNFAVAAGNWVRGFPFASAAAHSFLGGDFYGGVGEQLLVSKLMINLSERRPVEFMTTVSHSLADHEWLKPQAAIDTLAASTTACHAAFLAILSVDPDGRLNAGALERVRRTFALTAPYEPHLGGQAIEEVAVYFSDCSKMSFDENGTAVAVAATGSSIDYPHLHALTGACRILQQAHIPFGVITRRQLDDLGRFRVLVLPNLLRMTPAEVEAVRTYVRNGGRVYASRYTSLTLTDGSRSEDFRLADVFGCHYDGMETGRIIYLSPSAGPLAEALGAERALSHWIDKRDRRGAIRLSPRFEGQAHATLTLPYGYPSSGSISGNDWASIHCFPPWEHTATPTVVQHAFGTGQCIYSAADIEAGQSVSHDRLFASLISLLAGGRSCFQCDAHPNIHVTIVEQAEKRRLVLTFVDLAGSDPPMPTRGFQFTIRPPAGQAFSCLRRLPGNRRIKAQIGTDGSLTAKVPAFETVAMYAAELRQRVDSEH